VSLLSMLLLNSFLLIYDKPLNKKETPAGFCMNLGGVLNFYREYQKQQNRWRHTFCYNNVVKKETSPSV
ncbi:MAG: hypothetical protein K0Q65_1926, partial [Clostridia bacterium]|nr:hypothetical protein [Clostridia bacterium]